MELGELIVHIDQRQSQIDSYRPLSAEQEQLKSYVLPIANEIYTIIEENS